MTTQTSYAENMSPLPPGTIAGQMDNARVVTGICETASPGIPFGRAVSQGTLSDEGTVLGGTLANFKGVAVRDVTLRGDVATADLDKYQAPNSMAILESGDIWVEPAEAVTAHAQAYYVQATGIWTDNSSGNLAVPGAFFKTSCGVGGRAILSLRGGRAA